MAALRASPPAAGARVVGVGRIPQRLQGRQAGHRRTLRADGDDRVFLRRLRSPHGALLQHFYRLHCETVMQRLKNNEMLCEFIGCGLIGLPAYCTGERVQAFALRSSGMLV